MGKHGSSCTFPEKPPDFGHMQNPSRSVFRRTKVWLKFQPDLVLSMAKIFLIPDHVLQRGWSTAAPAGKVPHSDHTYSTSGNASINIPKIWKKGHKHFLPENSIQSTDQAVQETLQHSLWARHPEES